MSPARRELHRVALRLRDDAEEMAVHAEVTKCDGDEFAAMTALQNWLTVDLAANTGTDEEVEIALDLVRGVLNEFPSLLPN